MRTRKENKEYMNKFRFNVKKEKMLIDREICHECYTNKAETLHHINEDHDDNRNSNLRPVCRLCHVEIYHDKDIEYSDSQQEAQKQLQIAPREVLRVTKPSRTYPKSDGCYIFLYNHNKHIRIRANIRLQTENMLKGLGFNRED